MDYPSGSHLITKKMHALFATLWTKSCQSPLSMEFSRQEYQHGLPFPPPEDLPNPGIKPASPVSPALRMDSLLLEPTEKLQGS